MLSNEQLIQSDQYQFPYHYIPHFDDKGRPALRRSWGFAASWLAAHNLVSAKIDYLDSTIHEGINSVVDLGCGDGALINLLSKTVSKRGERSFTGIDYDSQALKWANAFKSNERASFQCVDIFNDNPSLNADLLTCIEVIEHIPPERVGAFIEASLGLLREEGFAIFTVPHANVKTAKKHFQHFTYESLASALTPHYSILEMYGFAKLSSFSLRVLNILEFKFGIALTSPFISRAYVSSCSRKIAESQASRIFCLARKNY